MPIQFTIDHAARLVEAFDRAIYDQVHYAAFVAGEGERGFERNERTMIKRMRRKFEAIDPDFPAIRSIVGRGYSWDASQ